MHVGFCRMHVYRYAIVSTSTVWILPRAAEKGCETPCTRNSNNLMFLYLALQCFTQLHDRFIRVEYILKFHDSREFCRSSSMHKTDAIAHSAHVPESHNVNPLQDACTWYLFSGSDPPQDKRKQFAINYAYACLDCIQFHASLLWCWAFHQLIVVVCMDVIALMHHHLLL